MNNKTNTPAIDREKLRATIQERLECVKDELLEVDHDSQTRAYLDGQIYVLERLISDIDFGLWAGYDHAAAELRWIPIRSADDLPKENGYYLVTCGSVGIDPDDTTSHELNWFGGKWYLPSDEMIEMDGVIAWMKKPKPYTEPADNIGEGV